MPKKLPRFYCERNGNKDYAIFDRKGVESNRPIGWFLDFHTAEKVVDLLNASVA